MKGIDTPTRLTSTLASGLVKAGISHVGRYLDDNWKGINKAEADILKAAGLQIISIFEKKPTKVSYFTAAQGKSDALEAYKFAQAIGQPTGTAIYFTVDYDAQPSDYDEILTYFQAVKANLKGYIVGAYGSYSVLNFLHSKGVATYYMQTLAWSGGKKCSFLNIYQYKCDTTLNGIDVDLDSLEKSDVGAWGKSKPVEKVQSPKPVTPPSQSKPAPPTPAQPTGKWVKENNQWFYYENGKKRIGWFNDGKHWFYLKEGTGQMITGWYQVASYWYYFDQNGYMICNDWMKSKGKDYYLNDKGQMVTGQYTINGKIYNFDKNGALIK
jgi:hypothetical protein